MTPPFTAEQFLTVFNRYNEAVWPVQLIFYAVAAAMVALALRRRAGSDRWISGLLAVLWAWMGIVYHMWFFSEINPAAYLFGVLFVVQAGILLLDGVLRKRLSSG